MANKMNSERLERKQNLNDFYVGKNSSGSERSLEGKFSLRGIAVIARQIHFNRSCIRATFNMIENIY